MSEQSDPLRLLSLREAGAVLGIDWKAVRALVETGEIGAYRTGATGQPRIPRLALVAWQERVAQLCYAPPDLAGYDPDAEVAPPVKRARRGKNGREYITTGVRFAVLRRGGGMGEELSGPLRLMGLSEIAKVLHVHWREVRELVETGQLPVIRVGATGEPKIALATLEAWLRRLGEAGADRSAMGTSLGRSAVVLGKPERRGDGSRRSARADRGAA